MDIDPVTRGELREDRFEISPRGIGLGWFDLIESAPVEPEPAVETTVARRRSSKRRSIKRRGNKRRSAKRRGNKRRSAKRRGIKRQGIKRWGSVVTAVVVGAALLGLGLALPRYAYPRMAVMPRDPETVSVSEGRATTMLDRTSMVQMHDVDLTATVNLRGDLSGPQPSGGDEAVWQAGTVMTDSGGVVRATTEQRVCVDRRTSFAVADCADQFVNHDAGHDGQVRQSGLVMRFPFHTEPRIYPFYDAGTKTVAPMVYAGLEAVDRLPVYRFVQSIPQTKVEDMTVPGALVNQPGVPSVQAERTLQSNRAVWIEPTSGLIIRDQQAIRQVIRTPGGPDGTVALDVTLTSTPDTVRTATDHAVEIKNRLRLIHGTVPDALAGAGLLLILAGMYMIARRWRRGRTAR